MEERLNPYRLISEINDIIDVFNIFVGRGASIPDYVSNDLGRLYDLALNLKAYVICYNDVSLINEIAKIKRMDVRSVLLYDVPQEVKISATRFHRIIFELSHMKDAVKELIPLETRIDVVSKKRGRPTKAFDDVIAEQENKDEIKKRLHELIDGKKGKGAVLYIKAAIILGLIQRPTHVQFVSEFGGIVSKQNYNKCLGENKYTADEIDGAKRAIEK